MTPATPSDVPPTPDDDLAVSGDKSPDGAISADPSEDPSPDSAVSAHTSPSAADSVDARPDAAAGAGARPPTVVHAGLAVLVLGALGVVFGDIGTSPLYALKTVFTAGNSAVPLTQAAVYGVISMVFWSLMMVVSVKYVTFVMRADNEGEGGIMALIALVQRIRQNDSVASKAVLVAMGVFGAALFFGDAMITPAISVLSAVEGLEVISPSLKSLVLPICLVVLVCLFAVQRFGTSTVGKLFGPICVLWFGALALAGGAQIVQHPGILAALSPTHAVSFAFDHPGMTFIALSGIVLTITGVEALYADMGHFSRRAITRAWFFVVFPALTLNYMGQGALILHNSDAIENPFFLLFADWALIPMVALATAATVIASQAVISGAFSVSRQAVQLGFLPRLTIHHTSKAEVGQVYVPAINWGVLIAVVALVLVFGSSENLAAAYGIAVTGTLAIDTVLFFTVARARFHKPLWMVAAVSVLFLVFDLLFFSANLPKFLDGGWFPILIALGVFCVFMTWHKGRTLVSAARIEEEGPLREFVDDVHAMTPQIHRVAGTAIFLNANPHTTPLALRANVEHNHTLHESVIIVSIAVTTVPYVPESDRITVDDLGYTDDGIFHLGVRYGFRDETDIPAALALAAGQGLECPVDLQHATYFVSRVTLRRGPTKNLARWRKALFLVLARNAADPVKYFRLPDERTIVMGGHISI
ncbi:MAG TPA: potassium transporter Kup [Solirubrobacteraceae bacterium]|nr:potassium transporter Kup [Solirubrobacteraceae bacterium]